MGGGLKVELDRVPAVYVAGEVVRGRLTSPLAAAHQLTFKGVAFLKIKGQAAPRRIDLAKHKLNPTLHQGAADFQFRTSSTLATSVETKSGFVRYTLKAKAALGGGRSEVCRLGLTVVQGTELDGLDRAEWLSPDELFFTSAQRTDVIGCACVRGGRPQTLRLALPRRAFVSGESLPLSGTFQNGGGGRVESVTGSIYQLLSLNGRRGSEAGGAGAQLVRRPIVEERLAMFVEKHKAVTIEKSILIPPAVPSTPLALHAPHPIAVAYELVVSVQMSGRRRSEETSRPLVLGTSPTAESLARIRSEGRPGGKGPIMIAREPFSERKVGIQKAGEEVAELLNRYPFLLLPTNRYQSISH